MNMHPAEFGNQRFNLTRLHDAEIELISGEVIFELELKLYNKAQRLFLGILDSHRLEATSMNLQGGIAVSLNASNGEVIDPINGQGVIGYLDQSQIESESSIFLCLEFEKIKSIYIPKLTVGEEKILLPALHLPEFRSISLVVGNSGNKNESEFSNPHLMVTELDCGLAS